MNMRYYIYIHGWNCLLVGINQKHRFQSNSSQFFIFGIGISGVCRAKANAIKVFKLYCVLNFIYTLFNRIKLILKLNFDPCLHALSIHWISIIRIVFTSPAHITSLLILTNFHILSQYFAKLICIHRTNADHELSVERNIFPTSSFQLSRG